MQPRQSCLTKFCLVLPIRCIPRAPQQLIEYLVIIDKMELVRVVMQPEDAPLLKYFFDVAHIKTFEESWKIFRDIEVFGVDGDMSAHVRTFSSLIIPYYSTFSPY